MFEEDTELALASPHPYFILRSSSSWVVQNKAMNETPGERFRGVYIIVPSDHTWFGHSAFDLTQVHAPVDFAITATHNFFG